MSIYTHQMLNVKYQFLSILKHHVPSYPIISPWNHTLSQVKPHLFFMVKNLNMVKNHHVSSLNHHFSSFFQVFPTISPSNAWFFPPAPHSSQRSPSPGSSQGASAARLPVRQPAPWFWWIGRWDSWAQKRWEYDMYMICEYKTYTKSRS